MPLSSCFSAWATRLVDQLLTLSRVEADDARSAFEPVSLKQTLQELFQRMGSHRFIVDGQLNHFALYLQRGQRAAQLMRSAAYPVAGGSG
jgi:signal transduction histidine kinase